MKKSVSIITLVIVVFSACLLSFAQQSRTVQPPLLRGVIAEYGRISGYTDGDLGVFLRWEMTKELGNLGFMVYRVNENGTELLYPGMVPGSMANVGDKRTTYGRSYELYDPRGTSTSSYYIVNRFSNGNTASTSIFYPQFTSDFHGDTGYTKAELNNIIANRTGDVRKNSLGLPDALQNIVNQSTLPKNPAGQSFVVGQEGVKIAVKKEGMYRVTRSELETAGFDVTTDSANWRLFADGNEQAIVVGAGDQYIEFYGKGLDTPETDARTYFLITGSIAGKRVTSKILGNIGGTVISNSFKLSAEKKERINYVSGIENGDAENYFGRYIVNATAACTTSSPCISFDVPNMDFSVAEAIVTVKIQGFTNTAHSVQAELNGHAIGVITGSGKTNFSADIYVSTAFFTETNNILKFKTVLGADTCLFDSVKVLYNKKYLSQQNSLLFYQPGYRKIDITGFASANLRVFDVTLDGNPQLITDLPITQNGGTYSVRMPSNRPSVMYAVEDSGLLQVPSITPFTPSSLATPNNLADMIIISSSTADLITASQAWAAYRRSPAGGNFAVKIVDVADIYDEFSYGAHSAMAVNDFLRYAKTNWQSPTPRYVLVTADASYDPRNYEGYGYFDIVPTRTVALAVEESPSDEALADFNHDGLADMAIGRIPARTAADVTKVFNKTTGFETPANQSLNRGAVLAYDMNIGYDFEGMTFQLRSLLPLDMPVTYVPRGIPGPNPSMNEDPLAHQHLMDGLNAGPFMVNYSGHGSAGLWGSGSFFGLSPNHPVQLTNVTRQSIYTMLTCDNGAFTNPHYDWMAETVLKADGGGVATWASTTATTPDYQALLATPLYQHINAGDIKRMGDLITNAKSSLAGSDVGYSWSLLGDPALQVRP